MAKRQNKQRATQMSPTPNPGRGMGRKRSRQGVSASDIIVLTTEFKFPKSTATTTVLGEIIPLVPWLSVFNTDKKYKYVRFVSLEITFMNRRPATEGVLLFSWTSDPSVEKTVQSTADVEVFKAWSGGRTKSSCSSDCIKMRIAAPNGAWIPNTTTVPKVIDKNTSGGEIGFGASGTTNLQDQVAALVQMAILVEYKDPVSFADKYSWFHKSPSSVEMPWTKHPNVCIGPQDDLKLRSPESPPAPLTTIKGGGIASFELALDMQAGGGVYEAYKQMDHNIPCRMSRLTYDSSLCDPTTGSTDLFQFPICRWKSSTGTVSAVFGFEVLKDVRLWAMELNKFTEGWEPNDWYPGQYTKDADIYHTPVTRLELYKATKEGTSTRIAWLSHTGSTEQIPSVRCGGAEVWTGERLIFVISFFNSEAGESEKLRKDRFVSWLDYDYRYNPGTVCLSYEDMKADVPQDVLGASPMEVDIGGGETSH